MQVKVKFLRQAGRATLSLDATELHEYLTALGVEKDSNGAFREQPYAEYGEIDTYRSRISTKLLLKPGVQTVNLGEHFSQPVGVDKLNALAESTADVVRAIVDHYRPIEISVVINGKRAAV